MRIKLLTIALLFIFTACMSYTPIEKKESKLSFKNDDNLNNNSIGSDYFISGYIFNSACSFIDRNITNINITDTVCFYKIKGYDQYIQGTTQLWFFDITKEKPLSILPKLDNLDKIPNGIDEYLKNKIIEHNKKMPFLMMNSPLRITRYGLEYDNQNFNKNNSTKLTYYINYETPRMNKSMVLPISIAIDLLTDHPHVTDIVYIEAYNKNFVIENVDLCNVYDARIFKTDNYDELSWDFIKDKKINYLFIHFKMNKYPIGDVTERAIRVKITGNYSK